VLTIVYLQSRSIAQSARQYANPYDDARSLVKLPGTSTVYNVAHTRPNHFNPFAAHTLVAHTSGADGEADATPLLVPSVAIPRDSSSSSPLTSTGESIPDTLMEDDVEMDIEAEASNNNSDSSSEADSNSEPDSNSETTDSD